MTVFIKELFRTDAGFRANFNLAIQLAMGAALIAGALLARAKRFSAHGICQTAVMLLNLTMIAYVMWPSFYSQVLPVLPKHLSDGYYGAATAHGALGVVAELFGPYILLVAGTDVVPPRWCIRRWKVWMRVELGLWWTV